MKNKLWNNFSYPITHHSIISNELISNAITSFWDDNIKNINSNQHVICLFRIKSKDNIIQTLGHLQKLNKEDKDFFIKYIENILFIKSDSYKETILTEIFISYGIRNGYVEKHKSIVELQEKSKIKFQYYQHYKLPVTMDPLKYGKVTYIDRTTNTYIVKINAMNDAHVTITDKSNKVEIFSNGDLIIKFKDTLINKDKFIRKIGNNSYLFNNDSLDLFETVKPTRFIKKRKQSRKLNERFITLDIETRLVNNEHSPYLIAYFNGKNSNSFYLTDYDSKEDMFKACILSLCKAKYHRYRIYIHNLANFDGIFLLKELVKIGIVKPLINNGKLIQIQLEYTPVNTNYKIILEFRDSYQILLSSLKNLGKSFDVSSQKSIFPYNFINDHDLNYNGKIPSKIYFDNITPEEYDNYKNKFKDWNLKWNLKTEAIIYCINDCVSLYQIIKKFNKIYFNRFSININEHPTISSHSFRMFQSNYIPENTIPMIYGETFNKIKESYTGGATDMFIPSNDTNELVYAYDINSLYPFIMANFPMPVGKINYFEGDIRKLNPDAFGFFYCKITTPDNLIHPILQTHVKTKDGMRTVSALGTYEDMLFSAEIDNAMKLGYKFEILWGYTFKKGVVFEDFINDLYTLRLTYDKYHPMNYIAKLIMNSLYGRLGMVDNFTSCIVIDNCSYEKFENENYERMINVIDFGDSFLIEVENDDTKTMVDNASETHNVNIAIASAITSHARITMSQFKNNPNLKLFYTDTDSIYTSLCPDQLNSLVPNIVDNKLLGKLKLETVSDKAIFLAPKVYYLKTTDGDEIFKIKGLHKNVPLTDLDFENLLFRNSKIIKSQEKWFKFISEGVIEVKHQVYTLLQTDNKRALIYDSNDKLIDTKPYVINNHKDVSALQNIIEHKCNFD